MWSPHRVRYWETERTTAPDGASALPLDSPPARPHCLRRPAPITRLMPPRHILIVNARNVTRPVFVIGAPHSGAESVGRALKISPGFHVTIGQQIVLQAVYGFARRPSLHSGRGDAAAAVMRDAFAQGWQIGPASCIKCTPQCRSAAGLREGEVGPCAEERGLSRFGDASPDLTYCAEALVTAFPDALIVQVVRDGRDTVAAMLKDQVAMSWFRPSVVNIETEFPNPFYGVEDESDRLQWASLSDAGKCAMRWRGAIRIAARLRRALPGDQLKTLRYEDIARSPGTAAAMLGEFTGAKVAAPVTPSTKRAKLEQNEWRRTLSYGQLADIEKVAGQELRRLGYR
jgi:Sulfotransferase family